MCGRMSHSHLLYNRMKQLATYLALLCIGLAVRHSAAGTPDGHVLEQARVGMGDLLRQFWAGDETTGHIVNTWHGYTNSLPDPRGALWERATLFLTLDNASRALGDPAFSRRMQADWRRTQSLYTPAQLEACGAKSGTNWAVDDAGWSALMLLAAHRATGDRAALERARGLVNNAFNRWLDDQLGGGMWYRDDHSTKSLYQVAIVLSALRLWELTGDRACHDRALACYQWMETQLLRADGLYWCDYDRSGPVGKDRPNDIREGGSVVFLGGNMAMGVLHARLFRLTADDTYRARAIRTAEAIRLRLVTDKGIYLNDRDAWSNGVFAGDWAREVLTLPGIDGKQAAVLRATADSIFRNARTADGFYGGSWSGPAEGAASRWFVGNSKPQQIMTSANSVNMIVAAASLEAGRGDVATRSESLVQVDSRDFGDTNCLMRIVELERRANTSKLRLSYRKMGSSVGSSMFIMRGFYEVAKARGAEYFVNLKEGDDPDGGRYFIAGFTNAKEPDLKKEFGDAFSYENEYGQKRTLLSVSQFKMLFERPKINVEP